MMRIAHKNLTYKTLFSYSLVIIALLIIAVPVVAANGARVNLFDFVPNRTTGLTPHASQTLSKGLNVNHLKPNEERWYVYSQESFDDPDLAWISLALRYESEAQIEIEQVNFEVFVQPTPEGWFQTAAPPEESLGSGLRSPLPARQNVTESFWSGAVADQTYYVRVFNNSPFSLDYILEVKAEQPAISGAGPASAIGEASTLNTRQLAWTLTAQAVNDMTAEEAAAWMKEAQAVGWLVTAGMKAEASPHPDQADPQTLWRLTAQAIAGQEADAAAQWLIQADALGWLAIPLNSQPTTILDTTQDKAATGEVALSPTQPPQPAEAYTPINIYPNNPLDLHLTEVNSGRLRPYGEHWYSLTLSDLDEKMVENMKLTMFFTPRVGYISDRINFEIFPASQYQIWRRGDADDIEHLGLGMWTSRDEDPNTGERLWSGTVVDGDRYLIKVKNGTPDVVDYYLFPNDVENAELGNPTFHQSEAATGYVPYVISPPTRPGR